MVTIKMILAHGVYIQDWSYSRGYSFYTTEPGLILKLKT